MQHIVNIDKSGRIVIPKELRDEFGFSPDMPIAIEQTQDGLVLKPQAVGVMVEKDGIMVYRPAHMEPFDVVEVIRQMREERDRDIFGR